MSTKIIKSISAVFILSILIASHALAAQPQVTINGVMVDFDNQTISISGENFDIRPNPTTVSLSGFGNLNIVSNTGDMLVVDFPAGGIPEGDYTLAVSSGPGARKNDEVPLTVGAQGPQGDMGDQGDQGDQGAQVSSPRCFRQGHLAV
ncbi:MAG: hypothetical protein IH875_09505 [Candidatus Dadabacteria bacterium]|nr:hypothetical protein [Candidatus Dadabacteria bacterium]